MTQPLKETSDLLKKLVLKAYNSMADVDQRLRGNGYPNKVNKKDVSIKISLMTKIIDERVKSELSIWKNPSKLTKIYHNHPFLFWLIGIVIGIIGIVITLI